MRALFISLVLLNAVTARAEVTTWKKVSAWPRAALGAAIEARSDWFRYTLGKHYSESDCPYPGDAAFTASAIPVVATNPTKYPNYKSGEQEKYLELSPRVRFPISCNDGTTGLVEIRLSQGSWQAVSFSPALASSPPVDLFGFRATDQEKTRLSSDHYFELDVLPVDTGAPKTFGGAIFLAREAGDRFDLNPTRDEREIHVKQGIWQSAEEVMQALKVEQTP